MARLPSRNVFSSRLCALRWRLWYGYVCDLREVEEISLFVVQILHFDFFFLFSSSWDRFIVVLLCFLFMVSVRFPTTFVFSVRKDSAPRIHMHSRLAGYVQPAISFGMVASSVSDVLRVFGVVASDRAERRIRT